MLAVFVRIAFFPIPNLHTTVYSTAYEGHRFHATPQTPLSLVCLSNVQGVDPYSGGGGGGGGTLGGVRRARPRAAGGAAEEEGLDDLSLSSVSSTLASFFLFLAILRYVGDAVGLLHVRIGR